MKSYSSREILQILKEDGWIVKGQEGSHIQLMHPIKQYKIETLLSMFKQAGLKPR